MIQEAALAEKPCTQWEHVALTRWGSYLTEIEQEAIGAASRLAGIPGRALEVGCEGGRWSRMLTHAGWDMTCTDVNPDSLRICQRRVPSAECVLVTQEQQVLPVQTEAVRLLLCIEVAPVSNSRWFAAEAYRALEPGGVLVAVTWNRHSLRGQFVRLAAYLSGKSEEFYKISYTTFRQQLTTAGFSMLTEKGYCWFPFGRESNSSWVTRATQWEQSLRLHKLLRVSPWVICTARKPV